MPDAKDNVLAQLYGPQTDANVLGLRMANPTRGAGCRSEPCGRKASRAGGFYLVEKRAQGPFLCAFMLQHTPSPSPCLSSYSWDLSSDTAGGRRGVSVCWGSQALSLPGATPDTPLAPALRVSARGQPFGFLGPPPGLPGPSTTPSPFPPSCPLPCNRTHSLSGSLLLPAQASQFHAAGLCPCSCLPWNGQRGSRYFCPRCAPLIAISSTLAF